MPLPQPTPTRQPQAAVTTIYVGLLCIAAYLSSSIYPVFVASITSLDHLTASNVGVLATTEFLPFGLASMFAGRFLPERRLRLTAGLCLLVQLLTAYASTKVPFQGLVLCRPLFGIAGGTLLWIVYAYVARATHPGRLVAIYTTAMMIVGVAWSYIGPNQVAPTFGQEGVIILLVVPSLLALLLLVLGPKDLPPLVQEASSGHARLPVASLLMLLSIAFWSAFMAIFWVYSEALAATHIGALARNWLTVSLVCQIMGAAMAAVFAERLPYRLVLTGGLLISALQIVSLRAGVGDVGFLIWAGVYGFLGYFLVPFFVAALIKVDPSRRSIVYFPAAQNFAGSLGPLIVSMAISDTDLSAGLMIDLMAVLMAPVMFWVALALHASRQPQALATAPLAVVAGDGVTGAGD